MNDDMLLILEVACGMLLLGLIAVCIHAWYYGWRAERRPIFPIHEWMRFASSLDPPLRDAACQMIMQRRFSSKWRGLFLEWHAQQTLAAQLASSPCNPFVSCEVLEAKPGVYILGSTHGYYKIGYSRDVRSRISSLNTASPFNLYPIYVFWTDDPEPLEQDLHRRFADRRVRREWFQLTPHDLAQIARLYAAASKRPDGMSDVSGHQ